MCDSLLCHLPKQVYKSKELNGQAKERPFQQDQCDASKEANAGLEVASLAEEG